MKKATQKTVDQHFSGRDSSLQKIFFRVLAAAGKFGPVSVEPKKTSIHLCNRTAFAGIRVMSNCIALTVKSGKNIENSRIVEHEQTSANRWHLVVRLYSAKDVNRELVNWLRTAYDLSS